MAFTIAPSLHVYTMTPTDKRIEKMQESIQNGDSRGQQDYIFNPNDHIMQIKSKQGSQDYLAVAWRLVWFRWKCPTGTIKTKMIQLDLDRPTEDKQYRWNQEKRRSEEVINKADGFV